MKIQNTFLKACALSTILLLSGCGGGGSSDATTNTDTYLDGVSYASASFGTFTDCALYVEEGNQYGAKPIECVDNTLDDGWEIISTEVKDADGYSGAQSLSFNTSPLENLNIRYVYNSSTHPYSIQSGESHDMVLSVYGENKATGERRVMTTNLKVNGVNNGYYDVQTTHTYPTLIIRINLTDMNATKTATELHNEAFGFGLDQANFAMLRNSASSRSFVPVNETEGIIDDGVVNVYIDRAAFTRDDYQDGRIVSAYIKDAVTQADQYVDFSSYDSDGDGFLTEKELSIAVSFPQTSLSATGWGGVSMYSYEEYISDDGVKVLGYQFGLDKTNRVSTMGEVSFVASTFFHEQGHTIWGLCDLYDVDSLYGGGTGSVGLMDTGAHNDLYNFEYPSIMMAYSQVRAGFLTPTEINTTQNVTLYPATMDSSHNIVKVVSSRDTEFFYIENYLFSDIRPYANNISNYRADEGLGGVLITKVNTATGAYTNNNDTNRIVDVVYTDGTITYSTLKRRFFTEKDSVNDLKYSDGNSSGISFDNITFNGDGSISLDVTVQ